MSSRLELDTSVLKEKKQNNTSLTDLNHIRLFTDDFEIVMEEEKKTAEKKDKALIHCCFNGDMEEADEEDVVDHLFQTSQKIAVEESSRVTDYSNYFVFLGSILIGLILCILTFEITNRRETDKNDVDIDNRAES